MRWMRTNRRRTETHWSVEAAVEVGRNHNQFILGRVAIGTDEASAEDKLETARFRLLSVEDAAYLRANGGKLADWAGARGRLAVEVIKADGTPIIADSKCFDMPGVNDRDPDGERPDLETDVVEIGGCDTMAGSTAFSYMAHDNGFAHRSHQASSLRYIRIGRPPSARSVYKRAPTLDDATPAKDEHPFNLRHPAMCIHRSPYPIT